MAAINAAVALVRFEELKAQGAIEQVSRYELEKCAHALWQVILQDENVSQDVIVAHQQFKAELALRAKLH